MPDIIIYQCFCSLSIGLNTSRERNTPKLNLENIWVIFPNFPTRKYAEIYQGANIPQGSLRSRKTVHLSEQIMSADNHPCIVSCQMEVIDYMYPCVLSSWVKSDGSALKFVLLELYCLLFCPNLYPILQFNCGPDPENNFLLAARTGSKTFIFGIDLFPSRPLMEINMWQIEVAIFGRKSRGHVGIFLMYRVCVIEVIYMTLIYQTRKIVREHIPTHREKSRKYDKEEYLWRALMCLEMSSKLSWVFDVSSQSTKRKSKIVTVYAN